MIPQLIQRMNLPGNQAAGIILTCDPFDLVLEMERVWTAYQQQAGPARQQFLAFGNNQPFGVAPPAGVNWDHLGYAYVLENTRAVQILRRVVREYRSGEGLGTPQFATQRWLDISEVLLFGAAFPIAPWMSTSSLRGDPEAVRRNAYWRLFGLDLAFGTDDNKPPAYDKAQAANTNFVALFEELLYEVWQAMMNLRNFAGARSTDDDRIFALTECLQQALTSRRQQQTLTREELAAATVASWVELTLATNTPVVQDLEATASSPADRLKIVGERVGLAPHSKSPYFFSMADDMSRLLRTIESGVIRGPETTWLLYDFRQPGSIANATRRVITNWGAAADKDMKQRARAVETRAAQPGRPQLVAAR